MRLFNKEISEEDLKIIGLLLSLSASILISTAAPFYYGHSKTIYTVAIVCAIIFVMVYGTKDKELTIQNNAILIIASVIAGIIFGLALSTTPELNPIIAWFFSVIASCIFTAFFMHATFCDVDLI